MVKNIQGGSKSKSQARKFSSGCAGSRSALRLSTCNLEKYACVTKYFGQGRCIVKTVDDTELQCVIRAKFKGHSRRSSMVTVGTILLVGLREWEGPDNYKICDLLEVYDNDDYNQLKSIPSTKVCNLEKYITSFQSSSVIGTDDFIFSDEVDKEVTVAKQIIPIESSDPTNALDWIDIDDI
jgi:hypothetical protein